MARRAYVSPEAGDAAATAAPDTPGAALPTPRIGDCVRYFDVDGGRADGEVLVGRIAFIQATAPRDDGAGRWLVEITEMEDVGDGYYTDYPSRKRRKTALRRLEDVAPLPASFVRAEDSYKVPLERGTDRPRPSHTGYDVAGYEGPEAVPVDPEVVRADGENYQQIKASLLRNAALAGAAGTLVAELLRGPEDAVIYFAGALAGLAYLFFLSIKTDTVGSADAKLGANVSNLRFVFPPLVLVGVALNNVLRGDAGPVAVAVAAGPFSTVTPEQFGAAMIGFLTYRVPLFASQLVPVLSESAGDDLVTVLLVSGPEATGKTTLVNRLLEEDPRFVTPVLLDRVADGAKFERCEQRGEFLEVDASGRYGLLNEGILEAAARAASAEDDADGGGTPRVVVVDADVDLAKRLVDRLAGARLVGVWV